jgi:hypothetical protein
VDNHLALELNRVLLYRWVKLFLKLELHQFSHRKTGNDSVVVA